MKQLYYSLRYLIFACLCTWASMSQIHAQTRNPYPYCYPTTGGMMTGTCFMNLGVNILSLKLNTIHQTSGCYGSSDSDAYRFWSATTTLIAGETYTLEINTDKSGFNYNVANGFWIDFDQDSTFDSVELIGTKMSNNNVPGGIKNAYTFKVPCNAKAGSTRLRVRSQGGFALFGNDACGTSNGIYGETWDFQITIAQPSSVVADFTYPDTVFVKTKVNFINTNRTGYISHTWDVNNDGTIEASNSKDISYTFNSTGTKCVKLRSVNCYGTDSIVKCVFVKAPTAKPLAHFTSCFRHVEQYDVVQLFDESSQGPYQWFWDVYDSTSGNWGSISTGDVIPDPWSRGNNEFSSSPEFQFNLPGVYTVELISKNDVGNSDKLIKYMTILVSEPKMYNLGFGTYGPNRDNKIRANYGRIYDDGGPNLNYGNNQGNPTRSYLSIVPGVQKPITIKFHQLRFADTNDYILLYDDDTVNSSKLLAKLSFGNNGSRPSYTSTSNSLYFIFNTNNGGIDSGYHATFYVDGFGSAYETPVLEHINSLSELKLFNKYRDEAYRSSYQIWSIDDVPQKAFNGLDTFRYTYKDTVTHKFCLELSKCDSSVKLCKYIRFETGLMGTASFDVNSNCVFDSGDKILNNVMLNLYDSNYVFVGKSNTYTGHYNFNIPLGGYTVELDTNSVPFRMACPYPGIDSAFVINNSMPIAEIDYSLQCKNGFDVGAKSVVPRGRVFPGQKHELYALAGDLSQWYGLNCANGVSGSVKVMLSGPVTYVSKTTNAITPSVSGKTFTFTVSNFGTINNNQAFGLILKTDTTANMNDTIVVKVEVTPKSGDNDTSNNTYEFRYLVSNSYDPNMKEVYPVDVSPLYNDWLTYTIHFQNTGNAAAQNIRITDTLAAELDISSFQLLNNSHPMQTSLIENALTFRFPDILLPDSFSDKKGSMGFVQYRIKPLPGQPKGTSIENTAFIYFDYNAPIVTNTTVNNFVENNSSIPVVKTQYHLSVYPNPVYDVFKVKLNSQGQSIAAKVRVYNVLGELIYEANLNDNTATINLNDQANGVYIVRVEGEGVSLSTCVIKQ